MELLEREGPLAALAQARDAAASGRGSVVVVTGEPGIGKTALVRHFAAELAGDARVLWGSCDDLSIPRPLGPLRDLAPAASAPLRQALLHGAPPERIPALVIDELAAGPNPTIVVLEDVQWADEATTDVVAVLGRRIAELPATLVLTLRSGELDVDHPLHRALGAIPAGSAHYVQLAPLSRAAVARLAGEADADTVHAVTGGNPFYVTELVAALPDELPPSVANAVLGRAARLDEPSRRLVELVSMVPTRIATGLLDDLLPGWAPAAEEPERRQLLTVDAIAVRFRHELARNAIRSSLPVARRRRLHGEILRALLDRGADPVDVVEQAEGAGDLDVVASYALVAGRSALDVGANREAASHFGRALDLLDRLPVAEQAHLLEDHAMAAYLVGDVEAALASSERAIEVNRALGDHEAVGRCTRQRSRLHWYAGEGDAAYAAALSAVAILEPGGPSVELAHAYSAVSQLAMLADRADDTLRWGTRAVELAHQLGADAIRAHALVNIGSIEHLADPDGTAHLEEASELACAAGDHHEAVRAFVNLAFSSTMWVRPEEAKGYAERGRRHADEHQVDTLRAYLDANLAWLHLRAGAWAAAETIARSVRTGGASVAQLLATTVLTELAVRRGDPEAALQLAALAGLAERTRELQRIGPVLELEVEWALTRDEPLDPRRVDEVVALVGPPEEHPGYEGARLAAWAAVAGRPFPFSGRAPAPHAAMLAGDWATAADEFGAVGWLHDRALLLSLLDEEPALVEALEIARALGARPLVDRASRRLRTIGASVPRGPRTATRANPAGLTGRELEVLELLARGCTNAEIAAGLYLSTRTVEHHVSRILTKLDVGSRRDAARWAVATGLGS